MTSLNNGPSTKICQMSEQMCLGNIGLSNEKSFLPGKYFPVLTTCQLKVKIRKIRPHCGRLPTGKCFLTKLSVLHLLVFNIFILRGQFFFFLKEVLESASSYRKKRVYFPRQSVFSGWFLRPLPSKHFSNVSTQL